MTDKITETLDRHANIALQLSGGKDSLACLYLLREHLSRITVYWLNSGDSYPETLRVIDHIASFVPNLVIIEGRQPQSIAEFGIPSDIVPVSATPIGRVAVEQPKEPIQDRYSCCFRSIMLPLHERMMADGVTLIIRGQKKYDRQKAPVSSGYVEDGIELLFPIEDWSDKQVMAYLQEQDAPIPRFYEMLNEAPDCMTCSAWWEKGEAHYLKRYHHEKYVEVQRRLDVIRDAVSEHIVYFNKEIL